MTLARMPEHTPSKAAKAEDVSISGTISTDSAVQMTVSSEGAAHIMSLLTDLYSDPNLAVLREYSSNAYDSHKEAGQDRPIEVTTPNSLNPVFVVEDFGVGMSPDAIRYIYSSYGASTKRNDFTQVGAFGLGCKSALTLTQSFTLISRKDGVQTTAIISRGEDGVGLVNVVAEVPTSEPNGVKVAIPITDVHAFNKNVRDFFYSWKTGTVLVDGQQPESLFDANYRTSKSGVFLYNLFRKWSERSGFDVIMGGVLYRVDTHKAVQMTGTHSDPPAVISGILHQISLVSEIPIGSIDLTPSREDIRYSDRSIKFLKELYIQICGEITDLISEDISQAPTRAEALKVLGGYDTVIRAFNNRRGNHNKLPMTWNGENIPTTFSVTGLRCEVSTDYNSKHGRSYVSELKDAAQGHNGVLGSPFDQERFFVVEDDDDKIAKIRREYKYFLNKEATQPYTAHLYVLKEMPTDPWITENDQYKFIKTQEIFDIASAFRKETREQRKQTNAPAKIYDYTILEKDSNGKVVLNTVGHDTLTGNHLYYVEFDQSALFEHVYKRSSPLVSRIKAVETFWNTVGLDDKAKIVMLPRTWSLAALEKRVEPHKVHSLLEKAKSHSKTLAGPKKEVLAAATAMQEGYSFLSTIMSDMLKLDQPNVKFEDKEITYFIELARDAKTHIATVKSINDVFRVVSEDTDTQTTLATIVARAQKVGRKYPLLQFGRSYKDISLDKMTEHAMLYVKAVVEASNERTS